MFLGTYTPRLDDKGRLTLPAKFREALAGGVIVTKNQDHSLAVYPRDVFKERARVVADAARLSQGALAFKRSLSSSSDEQLPDGQGRISLSSDHRRYAELTKDCVVIGAVDYVEIWDAEAWADYLQRNEEAFSSATDESLGIL